MITFKEYLLEKTKELPYAIIVSGIEIDDKTGNSYKYKIVFVHDKGILYRRQYTLEKDKFWRDERQFKYAPASYDRIMSDPKHKYKFKTMNKDQFAKFVLLELY